MIKMDMNILTDAKNQVFIHNLRTMEPKNIPVGIVDFCQLFNKMKYISDISITFLWVSKGF